MTTIAEILFRPGSSHAELNASIERARASLGTLSFTGFSVPSADVGETLKDLLDLPVGNIALRAWRQYRDVVQACERTRISATEREVVRLMEHRVVSHQSPVIEVIVGGSAVPILALDLCVEVNVASAELLVERGSVQQIRTGDGSARVRLSAGEVLLAEGRINFVDLGRIPKTSGSLPPPLPRPERHAGELLSGTV
jgi:hypothetical protein